MAQASLPDEAPEHALAVAVGIDVGGVDDIAAGLDTGVEDRPRPGLARAPAPGAFVADDVELVLAAALADRAPEIPANSLYDPGRRHVGPALRAFIDAMRDRAD